MQNPITAATTIAIARRSLALNGARAASELPRPAGVAERSGRRTIMAAPSLHVPAILPRCSQLSRSNFRDLWLVALNEAGIGELRLHDLRHTGNTMAVATGCEFARADGDDGALKLP